MDVQIRLLGAVELLVDGRHRAVGHARQRCVLAALAVDANRPVGYEQLVSRVWGEDLPREPRGALYGYIHRLRRALADVREVRLERGPGCYTLAAAPDVVDLHRFERLATAVRRETVDSRLVELSDEAVGTWHGVRAFEGLDTAWFEAARELAHQRRYLVETARTDAVLRLGRGSEVVADLFARVRAHPFDEVAAAQLMLALHGVGRTADALTIHRDLCRRLLDHLGTNPGEAIHRAFHRLLQGFEPPASRSPVATVAGSP
ncbi:AfsR/SARP family transcriptional regulator [Actinokineospora diospyrosa]|uniref:DNA-binding transcriptional activator of the SARP family n=1 Tax=Actinokineospora diospyrosa TaxID=103728 RepID=A0ABT1IJ47_9PSEU|nr:BTAD domain-containing putative transcriptional regulator [Actinokineospora diospyrosa]MCP2272678.1 DNA-binding transcriptional activator of the SARP family [Actinokineospora diospyrosa]